MATCKECVHDNACAAIFRHYGGFADYRSNTVEKQCKYFENETDKVEVVRCKKCKYYTADEECKGCGWCRKLDRGEYDHHFCSYGEKEADQ